MLSNNELKLICGGTAKISIGVIIGSLIAIVVGIIDGYLRPYKCN